MSAPSATIGARGRFRRIEDIASAVAFVALALLLVGEIVARTFFKTGIPASPMVMAQLVLLGGMFSGMVASRNGEHLSIALTNYLKDQRLKDIFGTVSNSIAAFTLTLFAWASFSFVKIGLSPWTLIWFVPDQLIALVMPLGFAVMAVRAGLAAGKGKALLPTLLFLAGTFFGLPVIAKFFWGFDLPDGVFAFTELVNSIVYAVGLPAAVLLLLSALIGTPLFVALGGAAAIFIQMSGGELDVIPNQVYTLYTQGSTAAVIPLFTIVGFFLSESKAGIRLVAFFKSLVGWLPGGMIIATVIVCAFFTSFTGASGVTILALGGILSTILIDQVKYPERFSLGLLTAVGSIGLLFPPSLPIILVGAATQTNILHMFAGGVLPGIVLVVAMCVLGIVVSVKHKTPLEPFSGRAVLESVKGAFWEITLPIWLVIGYFSGLLSIVETGAVGVLYIFVVEVFVTKDIRVGDLPKVFAKAVPIIGGILSILAMSQAFNYYLVDSEAPMRLTAWVHSAVSSKFVFLILLNLVLIVVGCLMDIFSAILVVLPLVFPLGAAYGVDPVHLGVIFLMNMELGFLTPPVGMNLFLASYRFKKPYLEIARSVLPFLLIQLVAVLVVTYVPWFTEALLPLFP